MIMMIVIILLLNFLPALHSYQCPRAILLPEGTSCVWFNEIPEESILHCTNYCY